MIHRKHIMTVVGGLIFVLVSTSCSSKAPMRTTRSSSTQDGSPPANRVTPADQATTERPVPTDRRGAGDNAFDSNRVVGCADQKGDMTTSPDCGTRNRPIEGDRAANDRTAYPGGGMTACTSRTDAKGNVIYDDPACPARYRQSRQQMGSSYENVQLSRESAFFDRHIEKAVKHAREAEIAGNQGHEPEMLQHAQLSLERAKEAQRAGNVPGLNEGIIELREALSMSQRSNRTAVADNRLPSDRAVPCAEQRGDAMGSADCDSRNRRLGDDRTDLDRTAYPAGGMTACTSRTDANGNVIYDDPTCPTRYRQSPGSSLQNATAHVRDARINLSQAAGMRPSDTRVPGAVTAGTGSMAGAQARTVKGKLIGDESFSRADGWSHYLLRDRNGTDTPITLTQDMTRNMRTGDMVEAQVDSEGHVLAITKDQ